MPDEPRLLIKILDQSIPDIAEVLADLFEFDLHRSRPPVGVCGYVLVMIRNYSGDPEDGSYLKGSLPTVFYPKWNQLRHNHGTGFTPQGASDVFGIGDNRLLAPILKEPDDRLDFWRHRSLGEVGALRQI